MRLWIVALAGAFLLAPMIEMVGEPDAIAKPQKKRRRRRRGRSRRHVKKAPAPPPPPKKEEVKKESDLVPSASVRGPTRLDFDDRLIQGQTNKSGAVYLFDRKETGISSMVRRRKSFRRLTIRTIYDR